MPKDMRKIIVFSVHYYHIAFGEKKQPIRKNFYVLYNGSFPLTKEKPPR